jgi:hypothetical protein|eukprot:COSAG01_NODE_7535_length_3161_cov_4.395820_4_plen_188_part_00
MLVPLPLVVVALTAGSSSSSSSSPALPSWPPTYNLSRSTFLMPCNYTGPFDPIAAAAYGVVDFDWSNSKAQWTSQAPMDCEESLVRQAELVKAVNPHTKVYVYRNLVRRSAGLPQNPPRHPCTSSSATPASHMCALWLACGDAGQGAALVHERPDKDHRSTVLGLVPPLQTGGIDAERQLSRLTLHG